MVNRKTNKPTPIHKICQKQIIRCTIFFKTIIICTYIHAQNLIIPIKQLTFERLCCSSISLKMVLPTARGARGTPSELSNDDLVLARNGLPETLVLALEKLTE